MKKFLSILLLVCLLWGLALPAAAEGEPHLYVNTGENTYSTEVLTVPAGLTRQFSFYTSADGTSHTEVTAAPTSSDTTVAAITGEGNPFTIAGLNAGTVTLTLQNEEGNPLTTALTVNVPKSSLQIRKVDGEWGTSLSGIQVNEAVAVELRLGTDTVFDICTDSVTVPENVTLSGGTLKATVAGTYTLAYKGYSITVTVDPDSKTTNEVSISKDNLSVLSNQEQFNQLLRDNHYSGSGDLTLLLPTGDLGSVTCNVTLNNGAGLILKGTSGTKMSSLTVAAENVSVDSITFTGSPSIAVNASCTVSKCKFNSSGDAFQLKQGHHLALSGNTYYNNAGSFTLRVPGTGKEMWNVTVPKDATEVDGNVFQVTPKSTEKAMEYNFSGDILSLCNDKWGIKYTPDCPYTNCYVVRDGVAIASVTSSQKNGIPFDITGQKYYVVEGILPYVTKVNASTKTVEIDETQSTYLNKVSLACGFAAAKVTDSKGNTVYSYLGSDGKLTFYVKEKTKEKYTITEVSTTKTVTTTKATTKTTSRSYKYTYQDYYLVTPAGFANGMRYVKDNLVTLDCSQAAKKPISLPVASMAEAAEKGYSLLVKTKDAELTLDAAALKSLAQQARGTTVLLRYQSLNHKTLTTVGQASIQSHLSQFPGDSADLAFLVTATSDSETIEDLQKGTVTLKIPFIVLPGTEEMENRVYALQSESLSEARETAVADGCLTTTLQDLTEHMVFQVGEPVETTGETTEATVETTVETTEETTQPETEPETTAPAEPVETAKKGGGLIIGLSVVLVILCGVVGFVFLRKRFRK